MHGAATPAGPAAWRQPGTGEPCARKRASTVRGGADGTGLHPSTSPAAYSTVQVQGRPCYLYRAIDRDGNLVDSLLSEHRDMDAARRFFVQAIEVVGHGPAQVTTDGHAAYPRAIRETAGEGVERRCSQYLHNRLEQDHRGIKERCRPMRGFGSFHAASRFCRAFDEVRDHFRSRRMMGEVVPLAEVHTLLAA